MFLSLKINVINILILWGGTLLLSSCSKENSLQAPELTPYTLEIPKGFPMPEIPADNALTENRVKLGKMLFFDKTLSLDSSISCGSCHFAANAFTDPRRFSLGVGDSVGTRNAMPIFNLAYNRSFFWDGGVPTLELQALAPIENHLEMNLSLKEAEARIKQNPQYQELFRKAYNREPDLYGLVRAIASFERTLISGNSRYDKYVYQNDKSALNASELRGMQVFFGEKAECFHCHTGFNFSDQTFQNNGLYAEYADPGRARITSRNLDIGKFKVPSLRNLSYTAPYMHDGSLNTLEEVLQHYMSGGKNHPNQNPTIRPFTLTPEEQEDLIAFLKTLDDSEFVQKHSTTK
jgi:cytochrome c peroxidase